MARYASIYFPYLLTEYAVRKNPKLSGEPFVLASPQRGRMVIDSASKMAIQKGIFPGMVLADCKAIFPELRVLKSEPGKAGKLLAALAEWCMGYTPFAAADHHDGIILDTTGCSHLWGGETSYLETIKSKLDAYGYTAMPAIAGTIGTAWGVARYGKPLTVVGAGREANALRTLPPAALRLEDATLIKLKKLGFLRIDNFLDMPRSALRRRFGPSLPLRIGQALGHEIEQAIPVKPVPSYQERLCSMEPIPTATGITIALERLLDTLCTRLESEGLGLRSAIFRAYRVDCDVQQIEIGTGRPSRNPAHLFKLFEHKIGTLEPDLGFETFVLEATKTEPALDEQGTMWNTAGSSDGKISELLDRVDAKIGKGSISRYLPEEHYWPERATKPAKPLWERPAACWRMDLLRPVHILARPEPIEVTAALPDYPPMLFRYKGKIYPIVKSDGPERIEQEWWLSDGLYRDYYCAEDEGGGRYWLFRSGPYNTGQPSWFIHGFFA